MSQAFQNGLATTCFNNYLNLNLSVFFVNYFATQCIESYEGRGDGGLTGIKGTKGIDDFLTVIANEYFAESMQIVLVYDESWDISDMIQKLTVSSNKAFVSYFLPLDQEIAARIKTMPPDHFTHKLLPTAYAFMIFVKDEKGFENIFQLMSVYPWFTKRARFLVMVKDKSLLPTKGIIAIFEREKLFNGVVVTSVAIRDDSSSSSSSNAASGDQQAFQQLGGMGNLRNNETGNLTHVDISLQVVALDPYPEVGHEKELYVGRWAGGELQTIRPIFFEKIDNLRMHTLHICVFEFPPLVIKEELGPNNYTYRGLEVDLLQELARLLNFTYEFFEPPEGERWGTDLGNNTWTGLIGEVQRKADFGFASVFLLDNREQAVDVSTPYDEDQGCFGVPRPEALQHWLGLVLPFSWQVWACIIAMAIVAGPIFSLITRPLGMDKSLTVGRGILYALGSLVSAQRSPQAKSHSLRTFIIAWLIFCWLACILYRVALIVSLTVGPSAFKIDSLSQLARSGLEWGGYPEVLKTFTNTTDTADENMFERFQIVYNSSEALERVATKGDFALLDSGKLLKYAANGKYFNGHSSMIHVTKECPTRYNVGITMPIGSPFLEKVNELIRRLQNSGIIGKWYSDLLHEAAVKNPNRKSGKKKSSGLDIGDLKLCLVLLLCGHFCAFLTMLGEHLLVIYRKNYAKKVELSLRKASMIRDATPSVIVTETDDSTSEGSVGTESLYSLPVEVEHDLCRYSLTDDDTIKAYLGDIKAISCPHFKSLEEE